MSPNFEVSMSGSAAKSSQRPDVGSSPRKRLRIPRVTISSDSDTDAADTPQSVRKSPSQKSPASRPGLPRLAPAALFKDDLENAHIERLNKLESLITTRLQAIESRLDTIVETNLRERQDMVPVGTAGEAHSEAMKPLVRAAIES